MAKRENGRRALAQTLAIVVACWAVGFVGQARAADPERIDDAAGRWSRPIWER